MKKIVIFIIFTVLFLTVSCNHSPPMTQKPYTSPIPTTEIEFTVEGDVPNEIVMYMNEYYNKIPENAIKRFNEDGWELILTNKPIAGNYYSTALGPVAGVTAYDKKTIYIAGKKIAIKRATIHEIGHFVDSCFGYPSKTTEFVKIFNNERYMFDEQNKLDEHNISSPQEYFAEIFSQICLYQETCKSSAPQSYEYVKQYVDTI